MIEIKVKAKITLACCYKYGGFSSRHRHVHGYENYKQHDCSDDVELDGLVTLSEQQDIDVIPYSMNTVQSIEYELPDGWSTIWKYGSNPEDVACPKCTKLLIKT